MRGGKIDYLEGDWKPKRVVIVEFESMEKARAFSDSPEYAPAKAARHRASVSSVLVVDGATPPGARPGALQSDRGGPVPRG